MNDLDFCFEMLTSFVDFVWNGLCSDFVPLYLVDIGDCLNRWLYVNCVRFDGYTQLSIVSTCIPMYFAKVQGIMQVLARMKTVLNHAFKMFEVLFLLV